VTFGAGFLQAATESVRKIVQAAADRRGIAPIVAECDGGKQYITDVVAFGTCVLKTYTLSNIDNLGQERYFRNEKSRKFMNVHLTPELEQLVRTKLKSGRYNSASEVVREALRLLEQRDEVFTLRKEQIRKQIEEGWASAKRGEFVDGDEVFDRIDAELEALERSAPK
jgi:antitoxin ParD1/3/4